MTWLFSIEEMNNPDAGVSGVKFSLLKLLHLTLMISDHRGDHISTGFGLGPFETSIQFSILYNKKDKDEV